jgi:hypothetical protein
MMRLAPFAVAAEAEPLIIGHRLVILPADPQIRELIASKNQQALKAKISNTNPASAIDEPKTTLKDRCPSSRYRQEQRGSA